MIFVCTGHGKHPDVPYVFAGARLRQAVARCRFHCPLCGKSYRRSRDYWGAVVDRALLLGLEEIEVSLEYVIESLAEVPA